jgi:hypothetical protein
MPILVVMEIVVYVWLMLAGWWVFLVFDYLAVECQPLDEHEI